MRQAIIIHTDTRVIRRITTDTSPNIDSDESIVVKDVDPIVLSGFQKLDARDEVVVATQTEARIAGVDEDFNDSEAIRKSNEYNSSIQDVIDDPTVGGTVNAYFIKLKALDGS